MAVRRVVVDSSVIIKWFHDSGESQVDESRALIKWHQAGSVQVLALDLTLYELANVFVRSIGMAADNAAAVLDSLEIMEIGIVALDSTLRGEAAGLAADHGLTFYDAAYLALALHLNAPLITADKQLLAADERTVTPAQFAASFSAATN